MHDFQADIDAVQNVSAVPTILDVVCRATGMGFAAIARVTESRWVACQVLDNIDFGLPAGGELKVETTLCHEVRASREVVVIDDVANDPTYFDHHTPALYGLQSYISVPIVLPDGTFFGTLCAIDPHPAELNNPKILGTFKVFAELIAYHLDADQKLRDARASLMDERATAVLREQFIAVLGHDLRNPLASIGGGASILLREQQSDRSVKVLGLMRQSVLRMSGLIDNILDFARGRLGGGLGLVIAPGSLAATLEQVIAEIRTGHPDREIDVNIATDLDIDVDHARISQMFSNLLGNAVTHGDPERPIVVEARLLNGHLHIAVANAGAAIPDHARQNLFLPFSRGSADSSLQGLGLGLYIASEIAKAHGGELAVVSTDKETRFTFRMPAGSTNLPD